MAEYKSFHYLMHKPSEAAPVHIIKGPDPLSFSELYSPRQGTLLIAKTEKSFWRTQDRVEFALYENRMEKVLVVTARNMEKKDEVYRTIFLDLPKLYFELEAKAQGNRDPLTKKKNKKLDDEALSKSVTDYVLTRLNLKSDHIAWPTFAPAETSEQASQASSTTEPTSEGAKLMERMCTFDKMASDATDVNIEIGPPAFYCTALNERDALEYLRALPPLQNVTDTNATADEDTSTNVSDTTLEAPKLSNRDDHSDNEKSGASESIIKSKKATNGGGKKSKVSVAPMQLASTNGKAIKSNSNNAKTGKVSSKKVAPS